MFVVVNMYDSFMQKLWLQQDMSLNRTTRTSLQ